LFKDREGIHICADGDYFAAFTQLCDNPGLPNPALDSVSHLLQFICHDTCCAMKFKSNLWMHVEVAPPFDQFF
jgi:hypothetical protein